jgi:pimeloyl-ACP methyl ester carboxylesterase
MLSGDNDKFVLNPAYYSEYAKLIVGTRHEVVDGAGHRIEEEEPQKTADRIAAFIAAK